MPLFFIVGYAVNGLRLICLQMERYDSFFFSAPLNELYQVRD